MKKVTSIILLFILVLINACNKNDSPYTGPAEKTILVYLAANSNLASYALADIQEMAVGMADIDVERNNLVVLQSTGNNPQLFRFTKDKSGTVVKEIINEYESQSVVETDFMKSVFTEVFTDYPAEKYGLVLWSHADGWLEKIPSTRYAATDRSSDPLDIFELKEVLKTGPHFEYIYFESCFMSSIEVLYEIRSYADYFIACPAETPGPGAPYDLIMSEMFAKENGPERFAKIYCKHYLEDYTDQIPTNSKWTSGAALAVINSSALQELTTVTADILEKYASKEKGEISRTGRLCYDIGTRMKLYYDMNEIIKDVTDGNEDYQRWKTSFDKAMVYYSTTNRLYSVHIPGLFPMKGTEGLSFYLPRAGQEDLLSYYKEYEWYKNGGWQKAGW